MKLKIEIVMDNAAFDPCRCDEAARILRALADDMGARYELNEAGDHVALLDINGNSVGEAKVTR